MGVPANELVLGKHSGRHALALRFEELGYTLTREELDSAYHRFTNLADRKKRIYEQDLISLIDAEGGTVQPALSTDRDQWARAAVA